MEPMESAEPPIPATEPQNTEAELASFRQRWREEVSARTKKSTNNTTNPSFKAGASGRGRPGRKIPAVHPVAVTNNESVDVEPRTYHDLEDKEAYLKLGNEKERFKAKPYTAEPQSALEHYERAVEKEAQGILGDSLNLYRKAFKLDDKVHETYKAKHFPPSSLPPKPANTNPSNPSAAVPNPAHPSGEGSRPDFSSLIDEFSQLSISTAEPETDLSEPPPCPIAYLPEEILVEVLLKVALQDISTFVRLTQVCKRFTYLVTTEERIWKRITLGHEIGFAAMYYTYPCDLYGQPLLLPFSSPTWDHSIQETAPQIRDLTPIPYPTYRAQLRHRPRIRFNGAYISTVNYTRPGASHQSQYTWTSPVQIVTYYRYLRFFRDGTVISLLTTTPPPDVVHHLLKEHLHNHHSGGLPSAVMKDALRGRWRLSGPLPAGLIDSMGENDMESKNPGEYAREPNVDGFEEEEGDVHVETEGVDHFTARPKYMWKMQFSLGSSGRKEGVRNNRLAWKGFWSYNKLLDDWGEFGLRHDKSFYFSRVKSYGMG